MSKRRLVILPLAICLSACTDARHALLLLSYETALANSSPEDTTVTDVTATTDARVEQARIHIDFASMQAGDFKVTSASGKVGEITCVTLAPADDSGELRTALLVGEYDSIDDQPARVEIVGNLLTSDQQQYRVTVQQADGSAAEVTPGFLTDLVDGDNNHRLCLDVGGNSTSVFFSAEFLTDPRDDPNPDTSMLISER